MRLYHVVIINHLTGNKTYMTKTPLNHKDACIILSKITKFPWRTEKLEEILLTL